MLDHALFREVYGMDAYYHPMYPTSDHIIPWQQYLWMMRAIRHNWAYKRISDAQAVALGTALTNPYIDNSAIKRQQQDVIDEAFAKR